jgi:ABC-type uncharacterized transport system substrate-binding protein
MKGAALAGAPANRWHALFDSFPPAGLLFSGCDAAISSRRRVLIDPCSGNEVAMSKPLTVVAGLAAAWVGAGNALAHPHSWIDLRSRVIMNDEGRVAALELDWLFDDLYTAYVAQEFVKQDRPPSEFLPEVANTYLSNLAEYEYFTDVRLDGKRLAVGKPAGVESGLRDRRLWLRFQVPLVESVDPHNGRLTFAVYDPTYYIEILYVEGETVAFSGANAEACVGRIEPPNPGFEAVARASALDPTQSGGDRLGELFAETVVVECS